MILPTEHTDILIICHMLLDALFEAAVAGCHSSARSTLHTLTLRFALFFPSTSAAQILPKILQYSDQQL